MTKPTLSLAMIVKPSDEEAELLDRCLDSVKDYVDEICLTITGKNKKCEQVAKKYNAKVSNYEWKNHFADARNFNFKQATKDFILWLDCDDIVENAESIPEIIKSIVPPYNGVICDYLYEFNKDGDCIVRHTKTRIIKNDGSLEWAGKLHEDFIEIREAKLLYTNDLEIHHHPTNEDITDTVQRNIEIATEGIKENPDDPRSWWNYANSLMMCENYEDARDAFFKFVAMSESEEERYIAWDRIAYSYKMLDDFERAIDSELMALSVRPWYPDAWIGLGELYYNLGKIEHAKFYLLEGLKLKPPTTEIIAYNPRMYDFIPLQLLAKVYYKNKQPKEALMCLEEVVSKFPKNRQIRKIRDGIKEEVEQTEWLEKHLDKAKEAKSKDEIKNILDEIPDEMKHHPMATHLRNVHFVKNNTSGKEVAIYCADTSNPWGPDSVKTGIGGSEEAIINLSKRWAKAGYDVTVYASCGHKEFENEGVTWKPYWAFNVRDKFDTLILWRTPIFCDFDLNAKQLLVDMHDVIKEEEFTPERLKKIDKIMVKSKAQRDLYPGIKDDKFEIIPNGINPDEFKGSPKRDELRLLNTSSPDRGLECAIDIFKKIREKVPKAEFHWFYGWNVFDAAYKDNPEMMDWRNKLIQKMEETEGFFIHERIGHKEIAKEYQKAKVFLYPTEFFEIHCISAAKAQAGGAIPVTTNVGALDETVQFGWKLPYNDVYSNEVAQDKFVETVVDILEEKTFEPGSDREMIKWAKETYDWGNIAEKWANVFKI